MLDDGYDGPTDRGDALGVGEVARSLEQGENPDAREERCHACDAPIEGEPESRGLLVFPRGDEVVYEEPPLCKRCSHAIGVTALFRFFMEEDEG
jgi:hypothetical protein